MNCPAKRPECVTTCPLSVTEKSRREFFTATHIDIYGTLKRHLYILIYIYNLLYTSMLRIFCLLSAPVSQGGVSPMRFLGGMSVRV